ncbi:MAG: 30S ribosomal protein S9 [Nitrospinae bacterium]|nr:30S ribosomal protein S9 [Nitrospinota bacterium]
MATQTENRYYATGRRKNATARVWVLPGSGTVKVNKVAPRDYFKRDTSEMLLLQPLKITGLKDKMDVVATVRGGGLSGQAGAVRHGIARALQVYDETLRGALKKAGMLTRDPREKERKKPGRARARKRFQFSKR